MDSHPKFKFLVYLIFSLSGFCALVYEVLWTKYLSLTFGTTMYAVSIVAATFMGGIALGSYLLGRYADNQSNLLRTYAYLEIGIVLTALLFPPTLKCVEWANVIFAHTFPNQVFLDHALHLFFSAMLLVPPTVCMGGTFPLMCRFFARKKSGGQIGRLYAMNTLGATLGAFLAGYLLIPELGLSTTCYLAVGLNLIIAAIAFWLANKFGETSPHDVSEVKRPEQPLEAIKHRPILITIGLIGFFSLAYEILWTRVFLLFLGNTTYAFALMLSAYLVCIAIGGAIYAYKVHPGLDEKKLFIRLATMMSLSILITSPFYDYLANLFQAAHEFSNDSWALLTISSYVIVFAVICVPVIISGSLLPAAVAIMNPGRDKTGEGVGLVVLHNTSGAVLGSLLAGFVLISAIGLEYSFRLLAIGNLVLAVVLYLIFRKQTNLGKFSPIMAAIGLVLALTPTNWNQNHMNSGVYYYASMIEQRGGIEKAMSDYDLLEVKEGIDTTITIKQSKSGNIKFFTVNGKTDGGNGRDMATQILIGQLPILLHPDPQDVMVIGLGTGITLGGVSVHPVKRIDCSEISPGVVEVSRFFTQENRMVLDDPRVNLSIEDGRNSLQINPQKYDVIISEPSNPWQSGNANLFTSEFYQLAAERLNDKGILCQWMPLYDLPPEHLQIAMQTFLKTFKNVMAFRVHSDLVLLGSQQPQVVNYQQLKSRMENPRVRDILAQTNIHTPADIITRYYLYSDKSLINIAGNAPINSDDRPILEFGYHLNLGDNAFSNNLAANLKAVRLASVNEPLPVSNYGKTKMEIADTFSELGTSCRKAGRKQEAEVFAMRAAEFRQDVIID